VICELRVEVNQLPVVFGGELGDAAVQFQYLGPVVFGVARQPSMEDRWDLAKDRLGVLLEG
jgi:hypothetical protein